MTLASVVPAELPTRPSSREHALVRAIRIASGKLQREVLGKIATRHLDDGANYRSVTVKVPTMSTTHASSSDIVLRKLDGLLPDLEALYKDVHSHPELSMQ